MTALKYDYCQSEPQAKYRYAPFNVVIAGVPTAGQTFAAADIKIRKAGGSLANCANFASVVDCGEGAYLYPLALTELDTVGDLEVIYLKGTNQQDTRSYLVGPAVARDLASSATSTTVTLPSSFASGTDVYRGQIATILSGTGAGQKRGVIGQAVRTITLDRAWATTPDATSEVEIDGYDYFVAANGINYANLASDVTAALGIVRSNTAQAGGASTITLDASASAINSYYQNTKIYVWSGTGAGQTRGYISYVGSTNVYTVDSPWSTPPDNTSKFLLLATGTGAAAAATAAAVMASTLRSGSTVLGHLRRMDALFFGKATGLLGALVTLFQPDGVTTEFTATQDTTLGTRQNVNRTVSETP